MKVAYLIRAHHAPSLLERLVRRIAGPEAGVFVHVSRTAEDAVYDEMVSRLQDVDRVAWLPRRTCRYGGFSLVEATLSGIDAILAGGERPGHTLLLSGQDYPLRSRAEIEATLRDVGWEKVHRQGRRLMPRDLIRQAIAADLEVGPYLAFARARSAGSYE